MSKLALFGGEKVRKTKFPPYNNFGEEEKQAIIRVMESGVLSKFLGSWHEDFYGGDEVKALEKEWAEYFGAKHAVAVNSATSALYCAVGAIGAGAGDEIIVSPYTMTASAVAPLVYNSIPVFADIEEDYFCLDVNSIEKRITKNTKAIIVVDIFGQPYDAEKINALAKKYNLAVIEDCAQAPGGKYKGKYAGTLGDIGIYSLNYHKHIHSGEGGILVTDNYEYAEKFRLIRNHAEAVIQGRNPEVTEIELINMLGFNYRMCEIEAAIAREQLKKLQPLLEERLENINYLSAKLSQIPCLELVKAREGTEHVYYQHPLKFNSKIARIHRDRYIEAVKAELDLIELRENEGIKIGCGYVKPLYLQPLFQKKVVYNNNCPFGCEKYKKETNYSKGICPIAEDMYDNTLIIHEYIKPGLSKEDLDDIYLAFEKVWNNIGELR